MERAVEIAPIRTTLGEFELTIVSDGTYVADGGAFFGVVPKTLWSKKIAADEKNRITAGLNSLLVRTATKNILIETGHRQQNARQTRPDLRPAGQAAR